MKRLIIGGVWVALIWAIGRWLKDLKMDVSLEWQDELGAQPDTDGVSSGLWDRSR